MMAVLLIPPLAGAFCGSIFTAPLSQYSNSPEFKLIWGLTSYLQAQFRRELAHFHDFVSPFVVVGFALKHCQLTHSRVESKPSHDEKQKKLMNTSRENEHARRSDRTRPSQGMDMRVAKTEHELSER